MAEGLAQVESTERVNPALVTVEGGLADRIPMGITMIQAMAIVKAWAPDPPKLCAARPHASRGDIVRELARFLVASE
jgi:hypothetical protein